MTKQVPPATLARLLRARDRLHDAPTEAPTVAALAAEVRLSRAHFLRSFVRAFGVTPHDYRTAVRLDLAKRALARGASVTETCLDAGFSSLGSFSSLFTRASVSRRATGSGASAACCRRPTCGRRSGSPGASWPATRRALSEKRCSASAANTVA